MNLDTKCTKCGVTLRRQFLMAMMIDAGAKTLNPCICPEGGDHDFAEVDAKAQSKTSVTPAKYDESIFK